MKTKYYKEIDKALWSYENFKPYHPKSTEWICNRINWCWQWKKITEDEKNELCNRIIEIMERVR